MNSVLNPEAPEFYPHLTSVTQGGYTTVHRTIRSSNQLPTGATYELFKTFTDFNQVSCQLSENVVVQSNQILNRETPGVKLKLHENESNLDKVVDANDNLLDRVNISIDSLTGANQPAVDDLGDKKLHVAPWNREPVISKIQVGSTMFIGAKNIPRPQLMFKEPVDNSENLWVPKISDKPNNIKPLALNILYNDDGQAVGYEHPYQVELELYQPTEEQLVAEETPPEFPPPLEHTPLTLVQTEAQVDALVAHLAAQTEMAVDLEHHSYRSYQGITCLIQITTAAGGDFVVDALAARDHLHKLNQVFTDPTKLKVFHGAESDVLWLQRDFGVYVVGMFDTHRAAKLLGLPALGLKAVLMHYCNITADKKFQLADWRIRPLPEELVAYARADTHYLLFVWRRMRRELLQRAQGQRHLLLAAFEASRQICMQTYHKEVVRPDSHLQLYVRSRKAFNTRQLAALKLLYKWRDTHARELDESTTYLLPNHMLLSLAESLPREVQGVHAVCSPMPPFVRTQVMAIHRMLLTCRELPLEPQLFRAPRAPRAAPALKHSHHTFDLSLVPDASVSLPICLGRAEQMLSGGSLCAPDVTVFAPPSPPAATADPTDPTGPAAAAAPAPSAPKPPHATGVVSDLNVDAKQFIPPYERYIKYRALAKIEEIKEFKEKEAKIAAISKGNELIKAEVLAELQRAREAAEQTAPAPTPAPAPAPAPEAPALAPARDDRKAQRKRKMSDKERKEPARAPPEAPAPRARARAPAEPGAGLKSLLYKNVNYRKFYDDAEKARKQPKMKFKKHK